MKAGSKWHVFYCLVIIILGIVIVYQASSGDSTPAKPEGLGNYVYIDKSKTLHTAHDCQAVYKIPNTNTRPVIRKKKDEIVMQHLDKVCSRCVTDQQYDLLRAMVRVNEVNGVFDDEEDNI